MISLFAIIVVIILKLQNLNASITIDSFNSSIICDDSNNCTGQKLNCNELIDDQHQSCSLECKSPFSCKNTIFDCPEDKKCDIVCSGPFSCEALIVLCSNNDCNIYGESESTLQHATVAVVKPIGLDYPNINIECIGLNSCNDLTISGRYSKATNISCIGSYSCYNMDLWCPHYTYQHGKRCNIHVINSSSTYKTKININTYNSWMDVNIYGLSPINILNESIMTCDGFNKHKHNCTFGGFNKYNSTKWDCNEDTSKCSLTYLIDDIHNIICDDNNDCKGKQIACDFGKKCNIECNGIESCRSAHISCNWMSNECFITGNGIASMMNATINCYNECFISCLNDETCSNASVKGAYSDLIDITCADGGCSDINIWCPNSDSTADNNVSKNCIMRGSGDIHSYFDIYSQSGFEYIDTDNYISTLIKTEYSTNQMHCGWKYESSCQLNSSLFCFCGDENDVTTTTEILSTDKNETSKQSVQDIVIIIACTIFGVSFLIFVAFFCKYCIKRKMIDATNDRKK
eukprot:370048_1